MTERSEKRLETADLLVELGCEELPPKALDEIREAFFRAVRAGIEKSGIDYEKSGSCSFSTPRRLALLFRNVATRQPDQDQNRRGPAIGAAFDENGNPTRAALGFARSVGKDVSELETLKSDQGEWLFANVKSPGKALDKLIYPILEQAIKQLPVPKPMRWADHDFSFIRPVHWLVVLHGENVIEGRLLGQDAGNLTTGHRIHSPGPHEVPSGSEYSDLLKEAFVLADPEERKGRIRDILEQADPDVHIDEELLNEVNNLVEWPVAVDCTFDKEFLEVPHSALIASMQDHQRFFPVLESADSDRVSNHFVAISNIESTDVDSVREGYERVIRPRLADARFFLEQDEKQSLEAFLPSLDRVIFQREIGTVGDKSKRISGISRRLAKILSVDSDTCTRAALLSKCDLMTQMVGEFPELQGLMGAHYAIASGESESVATAIGEHYSPRFAGDEIPSSEAGQVVSIADRTDTLVGIFSAGLRPSGNKDPFALRRAALGLVRIMLEAKLDVSLERVLALASNELSSQQQDVGSSVLLEVREFVVERLRHYYREQGYSTELVNSALASDWDTLPDLNRRLIAISEFMGQAEAGSLAAANKRIGNILRKSNQEISDQIDANRLILPQERVLFDEVYRLENEIRPLMNKGKYIDSLLLLAGLKAPVDDFFDTVMVMDEDPALRNNRLALLAHLKSLFDQIADLTVLG